MKIEIPIVVGQKKTILSADRNSVTNYSGRNVYRCDKDSITIEVANNKSKRNWYFNDHCFIEDSDGNTHLFAINNPYPDNLEQLYLYHPYLSHCIKLSNESLWRFVDFAFDETKGCSYVGAPFIIYQEAQSRYIMIVETMINSRRELIMAHSTDLYSWSKDEKPILTDLCYTKRDPCIIKEGEEYLIFVCNPKKGGSSVTVAKTKNFTDFVYHDCLYIDDGSDYGGIESPFVVKRSGGYYLFFTYAHRSYDETLVIWSNDYHNFNIDNCVTTLNAHAAEIVTINKQDYLSSCGPEDLQELSERGITLSKLAWIEISTSLLDNKLTEGTF